MSALLDTSNSVNDVIDAYPNALSVLSARGIDTCCGGRDSLAAAAQAAGMDVTVPVQEIIAGTPAPGVDAAPSCGCGCASHHAR